MPKLMPAQPGFAGEDGGAIVVEYALLIALVTVVLVLLLSGALGGGLQAAVAALVARLGNCFAPGSTTC